MSSPLEAQTKIWFQTISSEETVAAYQRVVQSLIAAVQSLWDALGVSWNILKETGKLVWLFICLGLVAFDWLIDGIKQLIEKIKGLSKQTSNVNSETYFADMSKALLEAGKTGAVQAISQAREQLGLPKTERPTATAKISASNTPKPADQSPTASNPAPSLPKVEAPRGEETTTEEPPR